MRFRLTLRAWNRAEIAKAASIGKTIQTATTDFPFSVTAIVE